MSPPPGHAPVVVPTPIDAAPAPADAPHISLGGACTAAADCEAGQICGPGPGGYCTSACGLGAGPCSGACVETPRGEFCMARCTSDGDCRAGLGYTCDPHWHACMLPNTAAIVPRDCGTPPGIGRDPAFAPATQLTDAGLFQVSPSATIVEDGSLVALFTGEHSIGFARIDAANRVQTTQLPHREGARASDPALARGANRLYATWLVTSNDTREIALATSADRGVTWSAPIAVHEPADCIDRDGRGDRPECLAAPRVLVGPGPNRKGEIVYVAYDADGLRVRASRDGGGGATFGPARTALAGGRGSLAVDANGLLLAVGLDGSARAGFGSGDQRVQFAASADGGRTFSRPQLISRSGELLPFYFAVPAIAVDSARKWIYIAYVRGGRDARWDIALVATRDYGKTWTRTRIGDDPACAIHMLPQLAVDAVTGTLHVAWYDSRGLRFAHATCLPGAVACRQVGRINDTPFAALSTVRDAPHWLGDHESLVVDNARRTLHAVWTQPVAGADGAVASRVFHARARLPLR